MRATFSSRFGKRKPAPGASLFLTHTQLQPRKGEQEDTLQMFRPCWVGFSLFNKGRGFWARFLPPKMIAALYVPTRLPKHVLGAKNSFFSNHSRDRRGITLGIGPHWLVPKRHPHGRFPLNKPLRTNLPPPVPNNESSNKKRSIPLQPSPPFPPPLSPTPPATKKTHTHEKGPRNRKNPRRNTTKKPHNTPRAERPLLARCRSRPRHRRGSAL